MDQWLANLSESSGLHRYRSALLCTGLPVKIRAVLNFRTCYHGAHFLGSQVMGRRVFEVMNLCNMCEHAMGWHHIFQGGRNSLYCQAIGWQKIPEELIGHLVRPDGSEMGEWGGWGGFRWGMWGG